MHYITTLEGWKITSPTGATFGGFAYPLVSAAAGQNPIEVLPEPSDREFTTDEPCPQFRGDGLCLAKTAKAASSGGISLSFCLGLKVVYDSSDVLHENESQIRVARLTVVDIWHPLDIIRKGLTKDLKGAKLSNADLSFANLVDADLKGANLGRANLQGADLRGADLSYANLMGANLNAARVDHRTNFRGSALGGASLRIMDLAQANLEAALWNAHTIFPHGFDPIVNNMFR